MFKDLVSRARVQVVDPCARGPQTPSRSLQLSTGPSLSFRFPTLLSSWLWRIPCACTSPLRVSACGSSCIAPVPQDSFDARFLFPSMHTAG
ncbi:hypothetical protein GOP47_0007565, partial [Adiantum capillus-veneris]